MRIMGCDLHARQRAMAMLDTETEEVVNITLTHEGNNVREFVPVWDQGSPWGRDEHSPSSSVI